MQLHQHTRAQRWIIGEKCNCNFYEFYQNPSWDKKRAKSARREIFLSPFSNVLHQLFPRRNRRDNSSHFSPSRVQPVSLLSSVLTKAFFRARIEEKSLSSCIIMQVHETSRCIFSPRLSPSTTPWFFAFSKLWAALLQRAVADENLAEKPLEQQWALRREENSCSEAVIRLIKGISTVRNYHQTWVLH